MGFSSIAGTVPLTLHLAQPINAASAPIVLENPSTLELSIIALATIGIYVLAKRGLQAWTAGRAGEPSMPDQIAADSSRRAA
jgi:hypothetical protein